jgi:hypothetical protein
MPRQEQAKILVHVVYLRLHQSKLRLSLLTRPAKSDGRYLSNQTSSMRKIVDDAVDHHRPALTCGCQQYAAGPLRKRVVSVAGIAAKKAAPAAARTRRSGLIAIGLLFNTRAVQPAIAIAGPLSGSCRTTTPGCYPIWLDRYSSSFAKARISASGPLVRLCH